MAQNASFQAMEPTGDNHSFVLPPALLAEVEAAAADEHRPVGEVFREVVERGLGERRAKMQAGKEIASSPRYTPAQAGERILQLRKGRFLPEGETIRSMIEAGRR